MRQRVHLDELVEPVGAEEVRAPHGGVAGHHRSEPLRLRVDRVKVRVAERQPEPHRRREGPAHSKLGDRAAQLPHRLGHVLLVQEVIVRATERHREVGLAHPPDGEPARRIEDGRLHAAFVHDPEPGLRVVHAAPQLPAEGTVPPVLRVIGAATRPSTTFALLSLEVRAELLGRLGDVAVGIVHSELDHRGLLGCLRGTPRGPPGHPSGASEAPLGGAFEARPLTAQYRPRYQAVSPSVPQGGTIRILADVTGNGKLR